jgi:hypothetical protein
MKIAVFATLLVSASAFGVNKADIAKVRFQNVDLELRMAI